MKKKNLVLAASLFFVAAVGAFAASSNVMADFIYYDNNNPETGNPIEITLDKSCPQVGLGCTWQASPSAPVYQLYQEIAGTIQPVKP